MTCGALATTAFEAWLADEDSALDGQLRLALEEIAGGFPALRR